MKKAVRNAVICCAVISIGIIVGDYFNLPLLIGLSTATVNWDVVSMVVSNAVVVALYLVTYHLLDKRNVEREINQRRTAKFMLLTTYDSCKKMLSLFSKAYEDEKTSAGSRFKTIEYQEDIANRYLRLPFDYDDAISEFAKTGVIAADEYQAYLKIQKLYRQHINLRLLTFDSPEFEMYNKFELLDDIQDASNILKKRG